MDEHIPKAVTEGLCRRGVDVLSAQEAGMLGANDYDQLSLANKEGRVIFTKDADFYVCIKPVFHIEVSFTHPNKAWLDIPCEF